MRVVVASHQPLPARGYGGPERVIVALVRGLAALGHRVTLLAPPGTRVPEATVIEVPSRKLADPDGVASHLPRDAEILHAHFPLRRDPAGIPVVQTIHRNLKPGAPPSPRAIFLSRDHARRHGSEVFVYNGLDPADYVFRRFPQARRAVRPVPRQAAQRQGLSLGGRGREAYRASSDRRRRLAAELHGLREIRR